MQVNSPILPLVSGTFNNTPVTDTDEDIQTFARTTGIALEKTGNYTDANGDGIPNAGDQITYYIYCYQYR